VYERETNDNSAREIDGTHDFNKGDTRHKAFFVVQTTFYLVQTAFLKVVQTTNDFLYPRNDFLNF
jgi:hypothetical protein